MNYNQELLTACKQGDFNAVKDALRAGANITNEDKLGKAPLNQACYYGHIQIITLLLEHGAPITEKAFKAAGDDKKVLTLLKTWPIKHANIPDVDKDLLLAALRGNISEIEISIKNKANVNVKDLRGKSPIELAVDEGHNDAAAILEIALLTLFIRQESDRAFLTAVLKGDIKGITDALAKGANINVQNQFGNTGLMLAAEYGLYESANTLLKHHADPDFTDDGYSALIWASSNGHYDIAKLLLEQGANPNILFKNKLTALTYACYKNHTEIVRLLLSHGASVADTERFNTDYGYTEEPEIKQLLKEAHEGRLPGNNTETYHDFTSCPFCKSLPAYQFVDIMEGESLPEAINRFIIYGSNWSQVRKCPHCNTYYKYEYDKDNEIFNSCEDASIRRIGPEEAIGYLKNMKYENQNVIQKEIKKITHKLPKYITQLENDLKSPIKSAKLFAVENLILHYSKNKDSKALAGLINNPDKMIRHKALSLIGRYNFSCVISDLADLLSHPDPRTRNLAVLVISEKGEKEDLKASLPALLKALTDRSPKVKKQAIYALSQAAEKRVNIKKAIPIIESKPALIKDFWGLSCLIYHYTHTNRWSDIETFLDHKDQEIAKNTRTHLNYIRITPKMKREPGYSHIKERYKKLGSLS